MQSAQKIEIGLGAATSIATLVLLCSFSAFFLTRDRVPSGVESMTIFLFIVWLISLTVAVGTYFNAVKQNRIALLISLVGVIFISLTLGFWSLILLSWTGIFGLFPLVPAILSTLTGFAVLSSKPKDAFKI